MDKYTVDLDQVLNDFEYSELTDQYNNSTRLAAGSSPTASQNNIVKHSINNVFHSLNEYLNTNINVNGLNQIDNNLQIKNNCTGKDINVLNINQDKFRDGEQSVKDCNSRTDGMLLDFNGQVQENNNLIEHEFNLLEQTSDNIIDVYDVNSGTEDKEITEVCIENSAYDKVSEFKEDPLDYTKVDTEKTDEFSMVKEERNVCEESIHDVAEIKENLGVEDKTSDINKEELPKLEVEEVSQVFREEAPKESDNFKDKETTVGFQDDLNLDESEINRLLEELEDEDLEPKEAESQVIAQVVDTDESTAEVKENQGAGDIHIEEASMTAEKIHKESELPLEEVKSESDDEAVRDLSLLNTKESIHKNEIELATIEGDDQITEPKLDHEIKHDSMKEDERVVMDVNSDEKSEAMAEIEKESSQDSLSRPQNLPLKGEGEEPKRKINLIGDPGSTPYNNVYINKLIPKMKHKSYDSDTDYSTSSSPTFSDISSTASTVSIDEVKNEKDKIAQHLSTTIVDTAAETASSTEIVNAKAETDNLTSSAMENPCSEIQNPTSEIPKPFTDVENATSGKSLEEPHPPIVNREDNDVTITTDDIPVGTSGPHVENIVEGNVSVGKQWLGKEAPLWVPDSDATSCLHCDMKFTVLKRRHHCRACGLVLCSKCCHLRFRLQYLEAEARVCNKCHDILNKDTNCSSSSDVSPEVGNSPSFRPHPNNPLEYCSTVSPLEQVAGSNPHPPAVMVPVGVLKRKGSNKAKSNKSVMFCDGIRPGSDLTNLDNDFDYNNTKTKKPEKLNAAPGKVNRNLPAVDPESKTFIPSDEHFLPPIVTMCKTDISYTECSNNPNTVEMLKNEQLTFAIHVNLNVHLKIINMSCCINKMAWCFSTEGLINVGQDEIVILLEYIDEESFVPKDMFYHINMIYNDAVKATTVKEMGLSLHNSSNFLDSKNHAGFVYIRPTFQCLENVIKPKDPYLIGILIHRWETPWAKLFPLRLILRLGAEYRYYPSPIISTRHRDSVFVEIGHTIINLLADFRNFSYTLPEIRGLTIHMEDKNTTVTIPTNRYDQVMKSMNNSSDHILAFAGNFSVQADSHLVCIQDTQGNENCYSTHAININTQPRKVTGASFIVFNGALKSSSGLTAKSNIVEDGLMIQVLPEHMQQIRENLRAMKNHTILCGCVNAASDETVNIVWGENDVNFNIGVISAIDNMPLNGIPSIRVHNGMNNVCVNGTRIIRWTEVFIIQNGDENPKHQDPIDISRVSESIAKATCDALVKYLDLLVVNNCQKIGIRTTLHVDNVAYLAGSNGTKLPPIYMKSLDNELIPVLHRITTNNLGENAVVLELVFRILNV